jgi:hypothetical protein
MKPINAKVTSITQGEQAGTAQLKALAPDGKQQYIIMVQSSNPKEIIDFEHGAEYTITFTKTKK